MANEQLLPAGAPAPPSGIPPEAQESPKQDVPLSNAPDQKGDPALEKESQAYISGLMKMLHSKDTSKQIVGMLKSGDPKNTIPQVALTVNKQMEEAVSSKGSKPSLEVLLSAGVYLVNDLVEIGNAAKAFQLESEEEIAPILKATLETYIQTGLKEGTIDPVELQKAIEPLMTEEHRTAGLEGAQATGLPTEPDDMTAMEHYATQRERKGMMKGSPTGMGGR